MAKTSNFIPKPQLIRKDASLNLTKELQQQLNFTSSSVIIEDAPLVLSSPIIRQNALLDLPSLDLDSDYEILGNIKDCQQ